MLVAGVLLVGTWFAWPGPTGRSAPVHAGEASDGAALFLSKGCATCHDGPDTASTLDVGPSLAVAPTWAGTRRPGLSATAYLRESILSPAVFVSPAFVPRDALPHMPVLEISPSEADALVAYLLHD